MLKRKFKARLKKVSVDPELRLAEIEVELELAYKEVEELEKTQPPYNSNDPSASWEEYKAHMESGWKKERKLGREKRMLMTPVFEDISEHGDVMSLKHWLECVEEGGFIDYDGFGRYVRDGKESNIDIYPSDVRYDSIRDDFDTIIWFNR